MNFRAKVTLDNGIDNHINSYPETLSIFSGSGTTKINISRATNTIITGATWTLDSPNGPLEADSGTTAIDVISSDYHIITTIYVPADTATNIDLTPYFELNDTGVLLSADGTNNKILSIVGSPMGVGSTSVSMTLSYKGLY